MPISPRVALEEPRTIGCFEIRYGHHVGDQRIRTAVAAGAPGKTGSLPPRTISVGVATTDTVETRTPAELMQKADAALYAAKNQGRNRVVCASPDKLLVAAD